MASIGSASAGGGAGAASSKPGTGPKGGPVYTPSAVIDDPNNLNQGAGLQSVISDLNQIPVAGKLKIPKIPQVKAQPVGATQVQQTKLPAWLNLRGIQEGLMAGLDLERAGQESETKNFLQRTGFADSTLATSEMGRIGQATQAAKAGINEKIYGMALNRAQLQQADRQLQAQLDQQRKMQNVANSIATGTFNVSAGLDAAKTSLQGALSSVGLAADVILKDYYLQVQQQQSQQDALQSFLEVALEDSGGGTSSAGMSLGARAG